MTIFSLHSEVQSIIQSETTIENMVLSHVSGLIAQISVNFTDGYVQKM